MPDGARQMVKLLVPISVSSHKTCPTLGQVLQSGHRLVETRLAQWVFQIEVIDGAWRDEFSRQGGFPALPGSDQGNHAVCLQLPLDSLF